MDFYACAFGDAPPRGRKSSLGSPGSLLVVVIIFVIKGCVSAEGGGLSSLCKAQPSLQVIYLPLHGSFVIPFLRHVTTYAGVASAGLRGVHAPLPKPSVFFILAMLRVWEITLLLGPGWLKLMGACSIGARSRHVRLLFSLAHEFFPQTAPIVGSWFEGSFTIDVSEPKPNRPNTINLVEKRAQELGLCEDFVNGLVGLLGSGIIKGVKEE